MNTEKSDIIIKDWNKKENPLKRASFTKERTFKTSPETFFKLLCPTTEYDWVPGWKCELLHSKSGCAEYNAIFKSSFLGSEEIWVCSRYEPNSTIEFTRVSENFSAKLDISLADNSDGTVTSIWVTTISALNSKGNRFIDEVESYEKRFDGIFNALDHYINTGEMIS